MLPAPQATAAERNHALLSAVVELSVEAIISVDLDGTVQTWNAGAERLFGNAAQAAIGRPIRQIVPPELYAVAAEKFASVYQGQTFDAFETKALTCDGRVIHIAVTAFPLSSQAGQVIGAACMIRDISERQQMQAALRISEARLHYALDASNEGMWDWHIPTNSDITARIQMDELTRIQRDVSQGLSASTDLPQAFALILESALRLESIDSGALYVVTAEGGLDLVVHRGISPGFAQHIAHYDPDTPQARMVQAGQPRYDTLPRAVGRTHTAVESEGICALAMLPVMHHGQPLAVLNLSSRTHDEIPLHIRTTLEILAIDIGSAIQRLRAEVAVRASEERFRLVVANSPSPVWIWDQACRLEYVSPAITTTFGLTPEQVMADAAAFHAAAFASAAGEQVTIDCTPADLVAGQAMDSAVPASWLRGVEAVHYCVQHPGKKVQVEGLLIDGDGKPRVVQTVFQGFERSGTGIEVVTITHDITEHYALEQLLQDTNAALEQHVAERTAELAAALKELEHATQLKDEFMAAVSHELRTPLTGVLAMAESLELQFAGPLNDHQLRFVHGIQESGDRLLKLVTGILRYTSLQGVRVTVLREPCRLADIGSIVVQAIRNRAEQKAQSVLFQVDRALPVIYSDSDGIIQVLQQLLDNAVKFTPAGGRLGLDIHQDDTSNNVRLVVWDHGIGIAAKQLDRIFEPFVQVEATLARRFEGVGLGLAFVQRMVGLLGGTLAVESIVGEGSRFIVTLPVSQARVGATTETERAPILD